MTTPMNIGPLINRNVLTLGAQHSLLEAARKMSERKVGSAVILNDDGIPGIITERDLMNAMAKGVDPSTATLEEYMTRDAITASPSWNVVEAAHRMIDGGFRHLVVVEDSGGVAGVLSLRDIVGALVDQVEATS